MATVEDCTTTHKKRQFTLEEQRSKVNFSNPHRLEIHQIHVDGCVIVQQTSCDYLVNIPDRDESIFVELKGSDVDHALRQLESTHRLLQPHRKRTVFWIVATHHCPLTSTEIANKALKIRRNHQARLHVKNSPVEWKLEKP